jgi:hypothetical protein
MVLQEGSAMTGSGDRLSSPFSPVLPERVFPEDVQQDLCKMSTRWSSTLHRGRVPAPRVSLPRTTSRSRASILYCCPSVHIYVARNPGAFRRGCVACSMSWDSTLRKMQGVGDEAN